jgi:hypothetical protein
MKTYIITIVFALPLLLFFSCGTGSSQLTIESEKQIKMKNYSVNSPAGDDWEYALDNDKQIIAFHRQSGEIFQVFSSKNRRDSFINIFRNGVTDKVESASRKDFANDFMDSEFKIMQNDYERTDYGEPELLGKDSLTINDKVLYRMKYELSCSLLPGSGYDCFSGEGQLYVYMPRDFETSGKFYVFVIEEYGYSMFYPYDFDMINSVITSFICDEDK